MVRPERAKPSHTLFYGEDAKYARSLRTFGEMAVVAIHEGKKLRHKLDNRGKTCMFLGYADDHTKDVYRFLNIHTKRVILSRDVRWLNIIWRRYKKKSIYEKSRVELFLDEEESSLGDEKSFGEISIREIMEGPEDDGNKTETQRRLGIDINMIGAREETLGRTRSETKELSSPTNESMERADLTLEDWIQETCLISAVTLGPTEPKTFQEAWHSPVEEERNNWQMAIRKEIKSMINRGVWRKVDRKNIPCGRRFGNSQRKFPDVPVSAMAVGEVGMRVLVKHRFSSSLDARSLLPACHKWSGLLARLPPMVLSRVARSWWLGTLFWHVSLVCLFPTS